MHLKSLEVGIPGGWHDECPHCGNHSVGITFGQLIGKVTTHYQNMKHPVAGSIYDEVETRLCAKLCPQDQAAYCQTGVRQRKSVRWGEVAAFLAWITGWFGSGKPLVQQAEAERRAQICAQCPYNLAVTGCATCRRAMLVFREHVMKAEPTSVQNKLSACGVCGCDLNSLVHVPLETLKGRHDYSMVPWCWQNPSSVNFSPN
jgi:hypothetical protein